MEQKILEMIKRILEKKYEVKLELFFEKGEQK